MAPTGRTREGAVCSAAVVRRGDRGRARLVLRLGGGLPGSGRVLSTLARRDACLSGRGDHRPPRRGSRSERPGRADRDLPRGRSAPGGGTMRGASNDVLSQRASAPPLGARPALKSTARTEYPARPGGRPTLTAPNRHFEPELGRTVADSRRVASRVAARPAETGRDAVDDAEGRIGRVSRKSSDRPR